MTVCRRAAFLGGGVLGGVIILLCLIRMWNDHRVDGNGLSGAQEEMLQRLSSLVRRADDFDEETALSSLGGHPMNGFVYRLDDHIDDAVCRYRAPTGDTVDAEPVLFEFDSEQSPSILPHHGDFTRENGVLSYAHEAGNYLVSSPDLLIEKERYGVVVLRVKAHRASGMVIGWSAFNDVDPRDPFRVHSYTVWIVPDGRFHTYRVDMGAYMKGGDRTGAPIRRIFIYPAGDAPDDIAVDYIRFLPKTARYEDNPAGVSYETREREMRRCMYLRADASISFPLRLPMHPVTLDFGLSSLMPEEPFGCGIGILHGGKTDTVFSEISTDAGGWSDYTVDLAPYAGDSVAVTVSTTGSPDNVIYWSNPVLSSSPESRFNVIIILEDALRTDRVSYYGVHPRMSPLKDRLAAEGVVFSNAISQATHTRSSCASFMTSLYPSATGVWNSFDVLDDRYLTLAEIMRYSGFTTASFTQNVNAGPAVGLHQGFETIFDRETIGTRAGFLYNGSLLRDWIRGNADRNFFLYLHLFDPHAPYGPPVPPGDLAGTINDIFSTDVDTLQRDIMYDPPWIEVPSVEARNYLYDEDVRYNDLQLGSLIHMLEEEDLMDHTLLVFMSDHGEFLGEHSLWGHWPPGYRQVIHVPLIFVNRKLIPVRRTVATPVQLIDIMPTVLDLAGIDTTGLLLSGTSLRPYFTGTEDHGHGGRLAYSEEVRFRDRSDESGAGSIFWRDVHILTSDQLRRPRALESVHGARSSHPEPIVSRVFHLSDTAEENTDPIFSFDPVFQRRMDIFHRNVLSRNVSIWKAVAPSTGEDVELAGDTVKYLRQLGYIE